VAIAERGKLRLHYEVRGTKDAPPVLLIMGMGFSSRAWGALPERLAQGYRVIVFDNRGSGKSGSSGFAFRIKDLAEDAVAVLDAAGVDSTSVFGISMGGMVAMELAIRHPDRVKAMALGATFAGWLGSRKPSILTSTDVLVGGLLSRLGAHHMLGRALISRETARRDQKALAAFIVNGERVSPKVLLQQMTAVTLHASTARLTELSVPTLVLSGDKDRLVPEENSRRLAELIPGARFVLLPGAGHCFPLERFDDTVRELTQFFGEHRRTAGRPTLRDGRDDRDAIAPGEVAEHRGPADGRPGPGDRRG
jgi:pimeloyl-ACP methyl ester carboxylesterase